jgi:hypothetical protein
MSHRSDHSDARRRRVEGPSRDPRDHAGLERPAAHPKGTGSDKTSSRTPANRAG